jgi:L-threonylcarbamoyladenylate synthase
MAQNSTSAPILPDTPEALERAAGILRAGGLVVIPTETVYGLAADATNPAAVARLFAAKGRPAFNPLIAHVVGRKSALAQARLSGPAQKLIAAFWPGPLTIVAPRAGDVCDLACAGLDTIALRAPAHETARRLLMALPFPLVAPSANISGHVSPTTAAHAAADLGDRVDLILDGGPCFVGVESTIVAAPEAGPATILRVGAIPAGDIEAVIGPSRRAGVGEAVAAPGMLARHYAPRAQLRLNASHPAPGEAFLGFGPASGGDLNLSPRGDLGEAAANLYAALRALDEEGADAIAVAPIPDTGLGEAINDRLRRAAEGR